MLPNRVVSGKPFVGHHPLLPEWVRSSSCRIVEESGWRLRRSLSPWNSHLFCSVVLWTLEMSAILFCSRRVHIYSESGLIITNEKVKENYILRVQKLITFRCGQSSKGTSFAITLTISPLRTKRSLISEGKSWPTWTWNEIASDYEDITSIILSHQIFCT